MDDDSQEDELVEVDDRPLPVKRLDGEVTRKWELASAGETYCEVWVGQWEQGGGEVNGKKAGGEKVRFSLIPPISLI